jgi:integration host factor subunit beta
MLKSELILILSEKMPTLTIDKIEASINCMLRQIEIALIQGEHIEVRGFGCFDIRHHAPYRARNPKTGVSVDLAARVTIHFKPGKDMRNRVNTARNESDIKK